MHDGAGPEATPLAARLLLDGLAVDDEGYESPVGRWNDVVVRVRVSARTEVMAVSYDRHDLIHASSRRTPQVSWWRSGQWFGSSFTGTDVDGVWPLEVLPSGALLAVVARQDADRWWAEVVAVWDLGPSQPRRLLYERRRIRSVRSGSEVWLPAGTVWDGPAVRDVAVDGASGVWAVLSRPDGLSRWEVDGGGPVPVPLPDGAAVLALTPLPDGMRILAGDRGDGRRYLLDTDLVGEVRRVIDLGSPEQGAPVCPLPVGVAVGGGRILLGGSDDRSPCLALAELRPADPLAAATPGVLPPRGDLGYHADPRPVAVTPPGLRVVGAEGSRMYLVDSWSGDHDGTFDSVYVIDLADA